MTCGSFSLVRISRWRRSFAMRGYGYDPGPLPGTCVSYGRNAQPEEDNSPQTVLRQIALILAITLAIAVVVNLFLFNFDIG
jgi:hypothetical protein